MFNHLLTVARYYLVTRPVRIPTPLSPAQGLAALQALRGVDGLHVQTGPGRGEVRMHSSRHCGRRGHPVIPMLEGALQEDARGTAFVGTLGLEPASRAAAQLFAACLLMMWAAIASDPAPPHLAVGAVVCVLYWSMLEFGYWIGQQDSHLILARTTEALAGVPPAANARPV